MSLADVNDENRGVYPGGNRCSSSDDIFAVAQPTGRPSILRQTENLPSKSEQKGMKVCFQTPRRDPVTKRILSPSKSSKMTSVDECTKALESLKLDKTNASFQDATKNTDVPCQEVSSYPDDDMPIQSKGGYQLDFDNLDAINPFEGSNKMMLSPARPPPTDQIPPQTGEEENLTEEPVKVETVLDDTLPFNPSVENSLADISSTDSSVITVKVPVVGEHDSCTATPDEKPPPKTPSNDIQDAVPPSFEEDAPLPPKGAYNLDFDNLDSINPFQMGGSKIQNSPLVKKAVPENDRPVVMETNPADVVTAPEVSVQPDVETVAAETQPSVDSVKQGPTKLEFNFDDGDVKQKPPPKKFGRRPPGPKAKVEKPVPDVKPPNDAAPEPVNSNDVEIRVPKGSYSFDFDKFDDPNFNPFGTNSAMTNSPKCSVKSSPVQMEVAVQEQEDEPEEKEALPPALPRESASPVEPHPTGADDTQNASNDHEKTLEIEAQPVQSFPPKPQTSMSEFSEEFVPGTTFLANDFDGQIDYLEQFGSSSFKESALRKQSLYLKFDPLLRESPKKSTGPVPQTQVPHPTTFDSCPQTPQVAVKEVKSERQKDDFRLLDVPEPEPNAPVLESLVPLIPQPTNAEDAIIEVLKYSQKDMDAAIDKIQTEAQKKHDELLGDSHEMRKIIAEFELFIAKMMVNQEKEKEEAQMKLNAALQDKEQVANDLNSMERSCSELFKRLEKYKGIVEGYKKNEETLKACAQDYLTRIKKEEQRYQMLKVHAEEKIGHANEEIAEVRSKHRSEISALQAQLKREQLKVQSLEQRLDQKVKETEELTKLCDELISNVQKG